MTVPIIDFSEGDESVLAKHLIDALTTVGFACLTNTGIWQQAHEYAESSKKFFTRSQEAKSQYKRPVSTIDGAGWVAIGREQSNVERPGDYKEAFNMLKSIKGNAERSPPSLDNQACWDLWDTFAKVSFRVMDLIGLGMNLPNPKLISSTHDYEQIKTNRTCMRIGWYPKVVADELKPGQIRCGEHSDYGSITLLYTSAPGLQVINRQTGEYEDAGYIEGGIFVNIGDLLQIWSGDVLLASKHRVVIPSEEYLNEDRVSIAFFSQPDNDVLIETLDGSGKYPPITSGQWIIDRLAATYDLSGSSS